MLILSDARVISEVELPSSKHMSPDERLAGTRQMLNDLELLAKDDGCVAAAWAIEWIKAVAEQEHVIFNTSLNAWNFSIFNTSLNAWNRSLAQLAEEPRPSP